MIIAITPLTQPFSFLLREISTDSTLAAIFSWISYIGFGFFSLILVGLALRDGLLLLYNLYQKIIKYMGAKSGAKEMAFDPHIRIGR